MVAPLALMGISLATNVAKGIVGRIGDAMATQPSASGSTASVDKAASQAATRKTANDFEKMFLEHTLDRLTQSGGAEGPLGENGEGGSVYRSMLVKEYAGKIQQSGGVGIADAVYRQMLQMQEGARG